MMFCPKCGSIMVPKKENGATFSACSCGHVARGKSGSMKEEIKKDEENIGVVNEDDEYLPTTEADCPKCKHKSAHYWTMQTRAADESETKFLKCANCKHTWRDYG